MADIERLTNWASSHAAVIEGMTRWTQGYQRDFWTTAEPNEEDALRGVAASGVAFLSTYAGPASEWAKHATTALNREGHPTAARAREIAAILRQWAEQVASGLAEVPRLAVSGRAAIAADDLVGQVHALIEDREAHPAAAIVLAGAALELRTRAAVEARQLAIDERPSLGAYYRRTSRSSTWWQGSETTLPMDDSTRSVESAPASWSSRWCFYSSCSTT